VVVEVNVTVGSVPVGVMVEVKVLVGLDEEAGDVGLLFPPQET